jgi:hypothetical protein
VVMMPVMVPGRRSRCRGGHRGGHRRCRLRRRGFVGPGRGVGLICAGSATSCGAGQDQRDPGRHPGKRQPHENLPSVVVVWLKEAAAVLAFSDTSRRGVAVHQRGLARRHRGLRPARRKRRKGR